jgi:hypothetical protein
MANGPLRTYFRTNSGIPEDEPDLTDSLLDSMITKSRAMPDFRTYPAMPGPPPAARPMPQMRRQGWGDVLAQALAGAGDVVSVGGGRPTNYLQQTMGLQQGLRNQDYQQAMAERAAMEQASRLAHEYEWRSYGAGQQEKRNRFSDKLKMDEQDLYKQMLGKQNEKNQMLRNLQEQMIPATLAQAEDTGELDALKLKALMETKGDPKMMQMVQNAAQRKMGDIVKQQQPGPFEKGLKSLSDWNLSLWADRPEFEAEVAAEFQKLMAGAPPMGARDSWWLDGRAQSIRRQAEENVKRRHLGK